ncbi:MAG: flavin reductase family protein [Candidatus Aenigmatarchaeota archaeon]
MGDFVELTSEEARNLVHTNPVSILTTMNEEGAVNAATFAWLCPTSHDPPMVSVMVSPKRYTFQNLEETGEFVINVMTKHNLDSIMYVGSVSFKNKPEKVEKSGLTTRESKYVEPPALDDSVGWIECEVLDMVEEGDHHVVVGKVLGGMADEDFWDERLEVEKAETLHHIGGKKFLVAGNVIEYED